MIGYKFFRFLRKHWWSSVLLTLSTAGILLGIWGFTIQQYNFSDSLYKTFQLFVLKISTDELGICQLQWSRWLIFAAFLWASFRIFFEIVAPQYLNNLKILSYKNHTIIYGLNRITINLVKNLSEKHKEKQIIVVAEENNKYAETLKAKNVQLIFGNLSDDIILRKTKLIRAGNLYTIIDNDKVNIKVAQSAYSYLETKKKRKQSLKCFVLIKDRELKNILEESHLFQYNTPFIDCTVFNINEMGVKYGLATNVEKFLPKNIESAPEILLIGLTEKTEIVLLQLAHCLNMKRDSFRFTIVENNSKKTLAFQKKYEFLQNFTTINLINEIDIENHYDSIIVCTDSQILAIEKALTIRFMLGEKCKDTNILVFCNEINTLEEVLKNELENKKILLINLFQLIADYIFELDTTIESKAKEAHSFWNNIYKMNKEWDSISGHFKQSNRNQILDHYLKTYLVFGERFEKIDISTLTLSDKDKETLAMMEHRRWMLEKFENGWTLGERDNEFKRHDCLKTWEKLPLNEQIKDYDAIDLMIKLLRSKNEK